MKAHWLTWALLVLCLVMLPVRADVTLNALAFFNNTNGAYPNGLVVGSDGNFYGTTRSGLSTGFNNETYWGAVFKMTTDGTINILYRFSGANNGASGYYPGAALAKRKYDGSLYGTCAYGGGANNPGTVFKLSSSGAFTVPLLTFSGTNGLYPEAALLEGADGNFYGTTRAGGTNGGWGTVFKMTFNGRLTTLYSFANGNDGASPRAVLAQAADGSFYGTTAYGGANNAGTVFRITSNGVLTTLYAFTGANDGYLPSAGLVQDTDSNLYGVTAYGGTNDVANGGDGTIFRITTNGTLTTLISLNGTNGACPNGLMWGIDGYVYGTTQLGGIGYHNGEPLSGSGTVFRMSTNGTLTTLVRFNGANGALPQTGLMQAGDGNLYGATMQGGPYDYGTVFRLSLTPPASPVFQTVTNTGSTITLTWSSVAGKAYQLQYTTNLAQTNWSSLASTITATGSTVTASDFLGLGPQRFYRVGLLP
jgi:uncharacterized repeat protein (TIGR03803 family)